jgi:endonuclease/exonuclease/phosphatase family metal-dependent hydrolase
LQTFPSRLPLVRIDHVFVGPGVEVVRVETMRTPLARVASDHLPLMVEIRLHPAPRRHPHGAAEIEAAR